LKRGGKLLGRASSQEISGIVLSLVLVKVALSGRSVREGAMLACQALVASLILKL